MIATLIAARITRAARVCESARTIGDVDHLYSGNTLESEESTGPIGAS